MYSKGAIVGVMNEKFIFYLKSCGEKHIERSRREWKFNVTM
jgi:hypothetical protein